MIRIILAAALALTVTAASAATVPTPTAKPATAPAAPAFDPFGIAQLANSPIIKALENWGSDDIDNAAALSITVPALQDTVGQACWKTFGALGAVVKAHPLPLTLQLASDVEAGRLFLMAIKAVCKEPNCSQMFNDLQNQIGALTPIPPAASFTAICAKIP